MQAWHIFDTIFTLVCMMAVALICALLAMRLSIHASVEEVPNVSGMTMEEASRALEKANLNITLENRFYSATVPSGHILSQSPQPGQKVRSGWHVRVTESTGPQKVAIPDTTGQSTREAAMSIRRSLLELGSVSHLPAPGTSEVVLAQTPPPNAEGVDKPQVSLLLSAPEEPAANAYVMPNLTGLSLHEAQKRIAQTGLRLVAVAPTAPPPILPVAPMGTIQMPGQIAPIAVAPVAPPPPPAPVTGTVTMQTPQPGYRVTGEDVIKVYLNGAKPGISAITPSTPDNNTPAPVQKIVVTP
ncbi:MAG: PASTA domain-containing protein [Acidobacteria bacterium]|nr:PASTA domain-containing protein [Acidobacteriota bacterium]